MSLEIPGSAPTLRPQRSMATIGLKDLPSSWALTTLGSVVDYGKTEKAEPAEIPVDAWVLELEDIEKGSSRILQRLTFLSLSR